MLRFSSRKQSLDNLHTYTYLWKFYNLYLIQAEEHLGSKQQFMKNHYLISLAVASLFSFSTLFGQSIIYSPYAFGSVGPIVGCLDSIGMNWITTIVPSISGLAPMDLATEIYSLPNSLPAGTPVLLQPNSLHKNYQKGVDICDLLLLQRHMKTHATRFQPQVMKSFWPKTDWYK